MEPNIRYQSKIRARHQTTIPDDIRKEANLNIGDNLIWMYDKQREEITIVRKPNSFANRIWEIGSDLRRDLDSDISKKGETE